MPIPRSERGAAMLAALCLAMVFAISLSSYIALCYTSLNMSTRNIMASHSSELAETGVEQALYSYNNNDWSNWSTSGAVASATMTMTSSGLVLSSTNPTALNYGNGMTGLVNLTVTNFNTKYPSITSQATFNLPINGAGSQTSTSGTVNYPAPAVGTSSAPLFVNAVAAITGNVRFRSAGTVDSYNSNPSPNVYQTYASSTPGYSAVIASQKNSTVSASVRLGNAVVNGYATGYNITSPSSTNWLSYSAGGKLVGPNTPVATSIDSSRLLTSPGPYQPVFLENLPSTYVNLPSGAGTCSSDGATIDQTATIGSTGATVPLVYNVGGGIDLTSGQVLTIKGPVVLICYSDVSITNGSQIQLTTPQASLQILLEYGTLDLGGSGSAPGIVNLNAVPLPKKVAILSTNNVWFSASISQTQPFYGVIYFPNLPITVSTTQPIYGSIVGSQVTFTVSPTIHYDLALRSPMPTYLSSSPSQYGAAFDNLTVPAAFGNMVATVP